MDGAEECVLRSNVALADEMRRVFEAEGAFLFW